MLQMSFSFTCAMFPSTEQECGGVDAMLRKIRSRGRVGAELAHDIAEIRPSESEGAVFRIRPAICDEDMCHLHELGKNHLYRIDLVTDEVH